MDNYFLEMGWQNGFEATLDARVVLSDIYIPMTPVPESNFGRLVLEDTSKENFEIIRYNRKDAAGVYVEAAEGGLRNEDGTSSGIHPRGARIRGNITAQDIIELRENMQAVIDDSTVGLRADVQQWIDETLADGVVYGGNWVFSGLIGDITAGVAFIAGKRVPFAGASKTFVATRDNYVFLRTTGVLEYADVAVGAAQPSAPTAGSLLISKFTTNATTMTINRHFNRGAVDKEQVDFASIYGLANGLPADQTSKIPLFSTNVSVGYGMTARLTRYGNLIMVTGNMTTAGGMPAADSSSLGETIPAGYRPRAGEGAVMLGFSGVGSGSRVGWNVANNGAMNFSNTNAMSGSQRVYILGSWITDNEWPS